MSATLRGLLLGEERRLFSVCGFGHGGLLRTLGQGVGGYPVRAPRLSVSGWLESTVTAEAAYPWWGRRPRCRGSDTKNLARVNPVRVFDHIGVQTIDPGQRKGSLKIVLRQIPKRIALPHRVSLGQRLLAPADRRRSRQRSVPRPPGYPSAVAHAGLPGSACRNTCAASGSPSGVAVVVKERDTVRTRGISVGRESQNQRHCESTLSRCRNSKRYKDFRLQSQARSTGAGSLAIGGRTGISAGKGTSGWVAACRLPPPLSAPLTAQNGRSSSSASSASGKSSKTPFPLERPHQPPPSRVRRTPPHHRSCRKAGSTPGR